MINGHVVAAIQDLLGKQGFDPKEEETVGQYVARSLGISAQQAEVLLNALDNGAMLDQAVSKAGIDKTRINTDLLTKVARAIGSTLAEIRKRAP